MSDLINPTPHFSTDFCGDHRLSLIHITFNQKMEICPLIKLLHPRQSWERASMVYRGALLSLQLSSIWDPWARRYALIISISGIGAFAFSRWVRTLSIDSQRRTSLSGSLHRVMCLEVSFNMPQFGQMLLMLVSHKDCLLFEQHHPDTCFAINMPNILG